MRVKICGITTIEDAIQAANLGADAIGLNFYPKSKRFISLETAQAILKELPPFIEPVALFVNETTKNIFSTVSPLLGIRTLQIHSDKQKPFPATPFHYFPAFPVQDSQSLSQITDFLENCRQQESKPSAILVDAHVPGEYGGTGKTAPWQLLATFSPNVPLILAGGLTPENVAEAIRQVHPYAVDVAGGVESEPGRKDPEKMRRFIDNAKNVV